MYSESPTSPSLISTVCFGNCADDAGRGDGAQRLSSAKRQRLGDLASSTRARRRAHLHALRTRIVARGAERSHAYRAGRSCCAASRTCATSSITLPSFGKLARRAERDFAAQLGDVADRRDDRLGVRRRVARAPRRAASSGRCRPGLSTTSRALRDLRMALDDRRHLRRMHEHALDLRRLVGAAHPALDAHVGAAARRRAGQQRRQVAGAEADQRIVGVERAW